MNKYIKEIKNTCSALASGDRVNIVVYDCYSAIATIVEVQEKGLMINLDKESISCCYPGQSFVERENPIFIEFSLIADIEKQLNNDLEKEM